MSLATAEQVVRFILQNADRKKRIRLEWFGGEPLLNQQVISKICHDLRKEGQAFFSSVTTNGFLFSEDVIKESINVWNVKKVQITLDGTQDIYNATKRYRTKEPNPFGVVTSNILSLLNSNIRVLLRLNVSAENGEDLLCLSEELITRYSKFKNCSIYCAPLYPRVRGIAQEVNAGDYEKAAHYIDQINHLLLNGGLLKAEISQRIRTHRCPADSDNAIVIFPEGMLGKCNHYLDSYHIGCIYDSTVNTYDEHFFKRLPPFSKCKTCPVYSECIRPQMCDGSAIACDYEQTILMGKLKYQILCEYKKYVYGYSLTTM